MVLERAEIVSGECPGVLFQTFQFLTCLIRHAKGDVNSVSQAGLILEFSV